MKSGPLRVAFGRALTRGLVLSIPIFAGAAGARGAFDMIHPASPRLNCTSRLDGDQLHIEWQITNGGDEAIYVFEAPNLGPAYVTTEDGDVAIARRYIPVEGLGVIAKRAPAVRKLAAGETWTDRFALDLPLSVRDPNVDDRDRTVGHAQLTCRAGWFAETDEVAVETRGDALFPSAHHLASRQRLVESELLAIED